ncbi:hypothetical protein Q8W40_13120 [Vibrio penaeicida]|uniref:hypothetical protein n=1 Tax=Vibrio penaeicida TaxID=104609 RepID=UPI002735A35D|nr:hypothetical protein [Vibrio penaeicida]MDP2573125.1 hypothetical protein [Vibrio penaeicida]
MNIAFYFPYPTVGGVSILFLRCAKYLTERHNVILIDINDGYMHKNLPSGCSYVNYLELDKLPDKTTIIFQSCPLWRIQDLEKAPESSKIVFWNLHPQNLDPRILKSNIGVRNTLGKMINLFSFFRLKKLRKTVSNLVENNAIYFMDGGNYQKTCDYLNVDIIEPNFLPITNADINSCLIKHKGKSYVNNEFRCILVSRIEGFKTSIVEHVITRLEHLNNQGIILTIVGDGRDLPKIKECASKLRNIKVHFVGYMHHDLLSDLICNQDLSFAMGTSALDSASLGIPTICLDYSNNEIKELYKFRFIYECENWNLGREINAMNFYEEECSLQEMIDIIKLQPNIVSDKTKRYYISNHSEYVYTLLEKKLVKGVGVSIGFILKEKLHMVDIFTKLLVLIFGKQKIDNSGFVNF